MHLDLTEIIKTIGYLGVFGIVFAESGLFFGFFLPGDSLLFTAGFLASQKFFDIWVLTTLIIVGAIAGDSVGYWFGRKVGQKIFNRQDSFFFRKDHLDKAHAFYEKHGGKTIILARFMPMVRTFAPIVAGAANMTYRKFVSYNVIGGLLWGGGITLAGFWLGNTIPNVDRYLLPIILVIILVSVTPPAVHILKEKDNRERLKKSFFDLIYAIPGLHPDRKS